MDKTRFSPGKGLRFHAGGALVCLVLAGTDLGLSHHLKQEFLHTPCTLCAVGAESWLSDLTFLQYHALEDKAVESTSPLPQ